MSSETVTVARPTYTQESRARANTQDMNRSTPLHLASRDGLLEDACLFIDHGADVNARNMNGLMPLHLALHMTHLEVARFLVDHGADVTHFFIVRVSGADVNARDNNGFTPLHLALREGHLEIGRLLIIHSADVNTQDMNRSTPLHKASQERQLEVARSLIVHGANVPYDRIDPYAGRITCRTVPVSGLFIKIRLWYGTARSRMPTVKCTAVAVYGTVGIPRIESREKMASGRITSKPV